MMLITLARKPFPKGGSVAANTLGWGTGGINVDGCRVKTADTVIRNQEGMVFDGVADGYKRPNKLMYTHKLDWQLSPGGRWPANLILQHDSACQLLGSSSVKGTRIDTRPEGDGGREDKSQWRFRPTEVTRRGYSDPDGKETVDRWECVEGCPVKELNGQSGFLHGSGNKADRDVGRVEGYVANVPLMGSYHGRANRCSDPVGGTASRFFKQVKE